MSEDTTTPHESNPPDGSKASEEATVEVSAQAVPKTTKPADTPAEATVKAQTQAPSTAGASQAQPALDKAVEMAKAFWVKAQPTLTEKSIATLLLANRFTNHFLDNIWPKWFTRAIAAIPATATTKFEAQKAKVQPTLNKLQPLWEKGVVPFYQKIVVPNWLKGLGLLRQQLPQNLATELTNRFLTITILTVFFLIYSIFSSLTDGKPAAVAKQSPASPKPAITRTVPSPRVQQPVVKSSPAPAVSPTSLPVTPSIAASPKLVTPTRPSTVSVAPTPKPSPSPVPSPAIDLAEIQTQLNSAAGEASNVIESVKTAQSNRLLQAAVGTTWYELEPAQQDQVAQKLWERSQQLKFSQIELRDSNNALVARSPVVGSKVVILKRQAPTGLN